MKVGTERRQVYTCLRDISAAGCAEAAVSQEVSGVFPGLKYTPQSSWWQRNQNLHSPTGIWNQSQVQLSCKCIHPIPLPHLVPWVKDHLWPPHRKTLT